MRLNLYCRFLCVAGITLLLGGCAAGVHHRAGMSAMEKGAYTEAVLELQQAAELAPRDVQYRQDWMQNRETAIRRLLSKAETAMTGGRPEEADRSYRTILEFDHNNQRAQRGLEAIEQVIKAGGDATEAKAALERGDTSQALQWATRALQRAPKQALALEVKRDIEALQAKDVILTPGLSALYKKPINLEFREASIKMIFDALSRTTGINFIFDRDIKVDQRSTVFLKQTTLEDAIDVILSTNQLEKKILNASSVLIYPNTPAKTKEYQDLMVRAFYLSNVEAKQAANMLKTVLKLKDVFVDDKYNLMILRESPETIALAEKLVALQDLEEPEVMLEVEVLEINRSRLLNLGVQLSNQFTITPLNGITSGSSTGSGTGTTTFKLSDLSKINRDNLSITVPTATINLQKTDGDANLLANPRLRVRDREKAKIMIGDKVPVVTTTATPNGFLSENLQYLDVGLKLEVEPEIRLHDDIGLKLSLEVSSLVATVKTNNGSQAYQIGTRNLTTALRLKDGETQVLAGLISDAERSDANRIPLLGDVPLLGRLFSSQKDDRQKTEIVMSITPHLIRNIRRKDASAESFWSGTEQNLRPRPLQLRSMEPVAPAGNGTAGSPAVGAMPAAVPPTAAAPNTTGVDVHWKGPLQAKVGDVVKLALELNSSETLRAAPLQITFDPSMFDVLAVADGGYFNRDGKGVFNHVLDKAGGRVSISATGPPEGVKGEGKYLDIELRALQPVQGSALSVFGLMPIGATHAIARPPMPVTHTIEIKP